MSYILDAIRKAEKQRRMDQVPTLESTVAFDPEPASRFPWKTIVAVLVVAGVIASLVWYREPATAMAVQLGKKSWSWIKDRLPIGDSEQQAANQSAQVPDSAQSGQQQAGETDSGTSTPADQPGSTEQAATQVGESVEASVETQPEPVASEPAIPVISDADRQRLDQIRLSVISYSSDTNKRFIMAGAELLHEGDLLYGYPILQIRKDSVLVDVHGTPWEVRL